MLKKRNFILIGVLVLGLALVGSLGVSGHGGYGWMHFGSEEAIEEYEFDEESYREIWRLQHRMAALNTEYRELLLDDAEEAELRDIEDQIFSLQTDLNELKYEYQSRLFEEDYEDYDTRADRRPRRGGHHHGSSTLQEGSFIPRGGMGMHMQTPFSGVHCW